MIYERALPTDYFFENRDTAKENHQGLGPNSYREPSMRTFSHSESPEHYQEILESQRRLRHITESVRKVLVEGQVAIIVVVPHIVCWVTLQGQQLLATNADDVTMIAKALSPKLGGPNSELVAEHVIRASTRAQLGISNRNSIELRASSTKPYKADIDCFLDHADWHVILALLTPMNDFSKMGYEEAQLSSLRYLVGVLHSNNYGRKSSDSSRRSSESSVYAEQHHGPMPSSNGRHGTNAFTATFADEVRPEKELVTDSEMPWLQNQSMNDFIPSMVSREVDYFYSMLPLARGSLPHHEFEITSSQSIREQELQATDPDDLDPHQRMRLEEQCSLSPVLPRRPRDLAEVQAEMENSKLMARNLAMMNRQQGTNKKNGDIRCLECGTDNSPEWRKGPEGPKTLCNRCGLRFAKKLRLQR